MSPIKNDFSSLGAVLRAISWNGKLVFVAVPQKVLTEASLGDYLKRVVMTPGNESSLGQKCTNWQLFFHFQDFN